MTTEAQSWPLPPWIAAIEDESERQVARNQLLLGYACLYYDRKGTAATLAESLGLTANAFALFKMRGKISGDFAVELERVLGRECFPRELWRPDIFTVD